MEKLDFSLNRFQEVPVLGIIRGGSQDSIQGVLNSCVSAGLNFVELTLIQVTDIQNSLIHSFNLLSNWLYIQSKFILFVKF